MSHVHRVRYVEHSETPARRSPSDDAVEPGRAAELQRGGMPGRRTGSPGDSTDADGARTMWSVASTASRARATPPSRDAGAERFACLGPSL